MRNVLIIISFIISSCAKGQDFSYESISKDTLFVIKDIDINKDGIKDKVACNKYGNDLIFYTQKNNSYTEVYHGDNYNMDGIYSLIQINGYTNNNNVLYIKNIFNGSGGQTIDYFLSYSNEDWQLSQSITNSSTYFDTKICQINYLVRDKTEECFIHKRNEDFKQDDIILEIINSINENKNLINCEFIFSILNNSPITVRNVTSYNNLAFALEQLVKYNESIYLLQKVLKKFPNRTVAYINLGDAYWGLKQTENARKAYQKYVELMKSSAKEAKIPKRVLERIK